MEFPEIPTKGIPLTVTEKEVFKLLEKIDTRKATSSIDFASWISKNNSHLLCIPVSHIINVILQCGEYPKLWKQAEVAPIPKISNPAQYKDMRPISLLFHLGKIAEQVIAKYLRADLPNMTHQYAYTPSLGTTDALVKFTTDIIDKLDDKNCLGARAVMLDFSKAFDKMQPDLAISKLMDLNVNPTIVKCIRSFLTERSQCVRYGSHFSQYLPSHIGVPQGTILGPLLWNVYIHDLVPNTNHVKYADDSTLYHPINKQEAQITQSTSTRATVSLPQDHLQEAVSYASTWCEENSMLLNAEKSNSITFTLRKQLDMDPILVGDSEVREHSAVKLLGVTFDNHLKFTKHVDNIIEKCRPAFHAMCNLRKAGVNSESLTLFYKARITPLLTYASPCWFPLIGKSDRDRLDKYQRHCLRMIYPTLENTEQRLNETGLVDICTALDAQCNRYVQRLKNDFSHALHNYTSTGGALAPVSHLEVVARFQL